MYFQESDLYSSGLEERAAGIAFPFSRSSQDKGSSASSSSCTIRSYIEATSGVYGKGLTG